MELPIWPTMPSFGLSAFGADMLLVGGGGLVGGWFWWMCVGSCLWKWLAGVGVDEREDEGWKKWSYSRVWLLPLHNVLAGVNVGCKQVGGAYDARCAHK